LRFLAEPQACIPECTCAILHYCSLRFLAVICRTANNAGQKAIMQMIKLFEPAGGGLINHDEVGRGGPGEVGYLAPKALEVA